MTPTAMLLSGVNPEVLIAVQLLPAGSYTSAVAASDVQSTLLQPPITYTLPATGIARALLRAFAMLATATGAELVDGSYASTVLTVLVGSAEFTPPMM